MTALAEKPKKSTRSSNPADRPGTGLVASYTHGLRGYSSDHEKATRAEVVRRLAQLKRYEVFADEVLTPPAGAHDFHLYLVPSDTLVGLDVASALGIHDKHDLFGGVVPHAFVSTKIITHPLVDPAAQAPEGWCAAMGDRIKESVLRGFSVFTIEDGLLAGRALLEAGGPLRIKPVRATGGRGQVVARDINELHAYLQHMGADELAKDGIVLEENLISPVTLSVGQVWVGDLVATYYGHQRLTRDNNGEEVYGGTDLYVVRGEFDKLLEMDIQPDVRLAVEQALKYNEAVHECFPGFFASRINYDVVQGLNHAGEWRSGVLEQSWRVGGATGAELAALEAFDNDERRNLVHASCIEIFGDDLPPPSHATVYFDGVDKDVGKITKYTVTKSNIDAP